jgi:hypothetical protein
MELKMKKQVKLLLLCLLIGVVIAGCGVKSPPGQSPLETDQESLGQAKKTEAASESETSLEEENVIPTDLPPTEEPTSTCTPQLEEKVDPIDVTPVVISGEEKEEMIAKVKADLASRLGISQDQISLVSAEAVTWNNSSLGCPKQGGMYLQVLTPGYKIILVFDGDKYSYHTDDSNEYILCDNITL